DRSGLERRAVDRSSSEPRAYLVRQDGDLVVLDVQKLAAAIARLPMRQVSAPAVERPPIRLLPFGPRPRPMTRRSEARALRENDPRMSLPVPPPPRRGGLDQPPIAGARPSTAAPAVFVLLPDGSLARPEMGSAARWHRMISDWTLRAGLLASSGASASVSGSQRFTLEAGKVTAVFTGGEPRLGPGAVGGTAAARGDGLVAARADFAPVRVLADDELAQAVAAGTALPVAGAGAAAPLAARALCRRAPSEIRWRGEPVVAFRAPDGSVLLNGEAGPIRLAAIARSREGGSPDGAALGDAAPSGATGARRRRVTRLASRSGALPAPALAALRLGLERTAVTGGYKVPVAQLAAAPHAIEVGRSVPIAADDPHRHS